LQRKHADELALLGTHLAEMQYPGWLGRLLTHRVEGLEHYLEAFQLLDSGTGTIKVFVEVAPFE